MIDLTPLEVRRKKGDFRGALRGYHRALVDDFLDLVAERMEQLVKENLTLAERAKRLDEQLSEFRERERALTEALVSAQELREEAKRQAAKAAELSRREAEAEAARIRAGAFDAIQQEEETLRRIRARRAQLIQGYRSFLERELAELSVIEETLELRSVKPGQGGRKPGAAAVQAPAAQPSESEVEALLSKLDEEA